MASTAVRRLEQVNKELWLVFSMFLIALLLNEVVDTQRMMLSFYTLPTLGSAYLYGRRHATLTALASVLIVIILTWHSTIFGSNAAPLSPTVWADLTVWGGILIITGYFMGTLTTARTPSLANCGRRTTACCACSGNSFRGTGTRNTILVPRVRVRDVHRGTSRAGCGADRGRARGGPAARHRQVERQPRAAAQGGAVHQRRVRRHAASR